LAFTSFLNSDETSAVPQMFPIQLFHV
jgi:hypothetical protein